MFGNDSRSKDRFYSGRTRYNPSPYRNSQRGTNYNYYNKSEKGTFHKEFYP